ncbi:hypothetical protein [Deferribacter abyssi]|uniref:hypothetical protein n=1 Tax=Deferribacter abyssi TaxID=213806 RepID=UPI003C20EAE7
MIKVEIFYNGEKDKKTPELVESIRHKFGDKVEVKLIDTSKEKTPEDYGTINPPEVVIDGKTKLKLDSKEKLEEIVTKAIF